MAGGCFALLLLLGVQAGLPAETPAKAPTMAEVLAAAQDSDWRELDPARTLYLDIPQGRVVIELAAEFAPLHRTNIVALARQGWFDGLSINRVQDNFVVQWGDPDNARPVVGAAQRLPAEFEAIWREDLQVTWLPDGDLYAPQVGFLDGMPVAGDAVGGALWPAHCYGTLGVGRDNAADSGSGAELYVVIGHAPRQLDRNITVAGRVISGMEWLSALPRGRGALGFYESPSERIPIQRMRVAADVPEEERTPLQVLRTDTATFSALIESRRNRRDAWYLRPAGVIDLCSVPVPVRRKSP